MKILWWELNVKRRPKPTPTVDVIEQMRLRFNELLEVVNPLGETVEANRKAIEAVRRKVYREDEKEPAVDVSPLLKSTEVLGPKPAATQLRTGDPPP